MCSFFSKVKYMLENDGNAIKKGSENKLKILQMGVGKLWLPKKRARMKSHLTMYQIAVSISLMI